MPAGRPSCGHNPRQQHPRLKALSLFLNFLAPELMRCEFRPAGVTNGLCGPWPALIGLRGRRLVHQLLGGRLAM